MTIIELNIVGLHMTGSGVAFKRSWRRNCQALRRKSAQWRPVQLRARPAAEQPAA